MRSEIGGRGGQSQDQLGFGIYPKRVLRGAALGCRSARLLSRVCLVAGRGGEAGGVGGGRGWTGQLSGEGAAGINPLGPSPFSRWSHQPWGSFRTHRGPIALQQENQGQLSERRRGALQRPQGSGEGGSPECSSQAPRRGLLVPLPPRPPPPLLHPPSRFFSSVIKYSCQQSRPSLGRLLCLASALYKLLKSRALFLLSKHFLSPQSIMHFTQLL